MVSAGVAGEQKFVGFGKNKRDQRGLLGFFSALHYDTYAAKGDFGFYHQV